jgi:hypothetical protein
MFAYAEKIITIAACLAAWAGRRTGGADRGGERVIDVS